MNQATAKNELRILFLGLDGSGKSTIIAKLRDFKNEEIMEIYPTSFMKADKILFENKTLTLLEISGLQRYRKFWKMFYKDIHGIIFVIDGSDEKRLKVVKDLVHQLDKDLESKTPIAFLINKQDVEGCMSKNQIKEYIDLDRLDSKFTWTVKNSIGYTGLGTKEVLHFIIDQTF